MNDMLFKDENSEIFFRKKIEKLEKSIKKLQKTDLQLAKSLGTALVSFMYGQFVHALSLTRVTEGQEDPQTSDLAVDYITERLLKTIKNVSISKKIEGVTEAVDEFGKEMIDLYGSIAKIKGREEEFDKIMKKFKAAIGE